MMRCRPGTPVTLLTRSNRGPVSAMHHFVLHHVRDTRKNMRTLLAAAIAARAQGVIATNHCGSCHNADFSGRDQMPRLAAQREDYLLKALRDYKTAKRPGYDATMDEVIRPVADTDIVDLSHYLARLK